MIRYSPGYRSWLVYVCALVENIVVQEPLAGTLLSLGFEHLFFDIESSSSAFDRFCFVNARQYKVVTNRRQWQRRSHLPTFYAVCIVCTIYNERRTYGLRAQDNIYAPRYDRYLALGYLLTTYSESTIVC